MFKFQHWRLEFVLLLAVLAAVLAACVEQSTSSFPHRVHLIDLACGKPGQPRCLNCNSCHSSADRGASRAGPSPSVCASCHRTDARRTSELLARPEPAHANITFNHDQHLGMKEIQGQCVACHGGVVQKGGSPFPPMSQCLGCHEHKEQWQATRCTPCHSSADLARTPPQTFLRHDEAFVRRHGQFAVEDKKLCQSCHTQAQCNGCHDTSQDLSVEQRRPEKIESTLVHGGDFLVRHAIEAQADPTRCARCHTPQTCDGCHQLRGVSANRLDGRNPHPPGWVSNNASGSSLHGREARRDLLLCASCHDQGPATNCIRCHKVGGYGGNPHPGGWRSARSPQQGMCRYCHE